VDDVLDLIGDERAMGKTLGLDLTLGKLTLPLIHALSAGTQAADEIRRLSQGRPVDAPRLRALLESGGSIDYALTIARGHVADGVRQLELLPPSEARTSLGSLAEFITQRQF
jgi:octaprenyl-diphosphate synthase